MAIWKKLYISVKTKKKQLNKQTSLRLGQIYIRKDEESNKIHIKSETDLDNL